MVGLWVGFTVKSMHDVPEGSPTVLWVCELPSLPTTVIVYGPRSAGPSAQARRVALLPQTTLQLAMQLSEAPKP